MRRADVISGDRKQQAEKIMSIRWSHILATARDSSPDEKAMHCRS